MPDNRGGGGAGAMRDLSQGANKMNLKRTLTIQKIFDFLGAPCKPIGDMMGSITSIIFFFLFPFLSPFFSIFLSLSFLERSGGAPGARAPLESGGMIGLYTALGEVTTFCSGSGDYIWEHNRER